MNSKPVGLSSADIQEIASIEDIREMWGAENSAAMADMLDADICAVKFPRYMTDGPGYAGELYLLMGGALEAPAMLIRRDGKLAIFDPQ